MRAALALAAAVLLAASALAAQEPAAPAPLRVLFLTHSAGFEHGVVQRPPGGGLALAEAALAGAFEGRVAVDCTQDCADLSRENLERYDVLALYTTGELPVPEERRAALFEWLRAGGGLVGIHCATDTWYGVPEYGELIGGYFDGHPWNERVRVRVEDRAHPATAHLGESFAVADEIYQFRDFRGEPPLSVLLRLDGTSVAVTRGAHDDYPLAWCRDWGEGRAFYTALGHRPALWSDARFLRHLLGGIRWAAGEEDWSPTPPPGAVVLFGGEQPVGLAQRGSEACRWRVEDGALVAVPGTGDLVSQRAFGDALLHVEFRVPPGAIADADADVASERGAGGVVVQDRYELPLFDSRGAAPGLGTCAALLGVAPPATDAARRAGEWQTLDVRVDSARYEGEEKHADPRLTVWWNGLLVHDDVAVPDPAPGAALPAGPGPGPLTLADRGGAVAYRNVWVLER